VVTAKEICPVDTLPMQCLTRHPVQSYRDLIGWQKSMDLVVEVYRSTESFPKAETYGLMAQLRRAAVSIPSNIAEGHDRISTGEFKQFLGHARGSLVEVETQILISQRLGYLEPSQSTNLLQRTAEIAKILNGLLGSLARRK
jgi:four helix bundle protein